MALFQHGLISRVWKQNCLQYGTACIDIWVLCLCFMKYVLTISSRKLCTTLDDNVHCCSPKDTLSYLWMFDVCQKGAWKWTLALCQELIVLSLLASQNTTQDVMNISKKWQFLLIKGSVLFDYMKYVYVTPWKVCRMGVGMQNFQFSFVSIIWILCSGKCLWLVLHS